MFGQGLALRPPARDDRDVERDGSSPPADVRVIRLPPTLSHHAVMTLSDLLRAPLETGVTHLVLDFREVTFVGMAAVGVIVDALRRARSAGGNMRICGVSRPIGRYLKERRLDEVLGHFTSEEEAVAALQAPPARKTYPSGSGKGARMGEQTRCVRCGGEDLIPTARLSSTIERPIQVVVDRNPLAMVLASRELEPLRATVCVDCGHVELFVEMTEGLKAAYQEQMGRARPH